MRSYNDEGIVLAKRNYSEADRILSIYSKHKGRISVIAKGVRKPRSRKRGHVEVFNLIKFNFVDGKGLGIITEAETIDSYNDIRKNLGRVALGYYLMEVVGRTTHEGEGNREVFDILIEFLERLKTERKLKKLRFDFINRLLTTLGFWPKGVPLSSPDQKLEEVIERQLSSLRVGRKLVE